MAARIFLGGQAAQAFDPAGIIHESNSTGSIAGLPVLVAARAADTGGIMDNQGPTLP